MISAAMPQRYGALTALVTGFQSTIRSRNGGQEMTTNRQSQKRPWVITGLLVLALLSTAMAGCRNKATPGTVNSTNEATSGTVNSTFVDVGGLLVAPTKVAASYPTEELNMGNDLNAGFPQFFDGVIYTFSYGTNYENVQMTAWDQATGRKLWSVDTGLNWIMSFVSDGTHLFLHTANTFCCLDKSTGATVWKNTPTATSPFVFDLGGKMVLQINKQSNTSDRFYVLGAENKKVDTGMEEYNPGIYILDGANGNLLGRIDLPALTLSNGGGELLCDGTTLYASIQESTKAEYPAQKSSLVAFDLTTNRVLWQETVDGEGSNLAKQGDVLVFIRITKSYEPWIDVWQIGATAPAGTTRRLWTRKTESTPIEESITSFAVDNTHVYLQGSEGKLMALDLGTGKEMWNYRFAPTKGYVLDGPNTIKSIDTYPAMTLTTTRDVLYVQDGGGLVAALDPTTGKRLWDKRISNLQIGEKSTSGMFVFQPVDKGFLVIASNGKVDLWN
jgi:outer membrane protein assembly factor BamB